MKKINKIILLIIFGVMAVPIAIGFYFYAIDPVDSCMDHGGCWDATDKICRKNEPNAQELCDRNRK